MALAPIGRASSPAPMGLDFQSLLGIIMTQLTYQDPLKPVDNFQFVSQLAQFSQLQQSQTLNDQITSLLASQGASQATSLLGRTIDYTDQDNALVSGKVESVSFTSGQPTVAIIRSSDGKRVSNISIADIANVRV
jgi:flagellar basal-body rod modification protein FlgD